jgi:hypothetical protein
MLSTFDANAHLHKQILAIRERKRLLQAILAKMHGARSSEPHPLLVSLNTVSDSDDEFDEEEDTLDDLITRTDVLSLAEAEDGSMQFFGTRPLPLARRASAPMPPTVATMVRRTFTFHFSY